MESLDATALPEGALLLVDSAPIIYVLESHEKFAARFAPMFERHARGEIALAVTTVTIAEVLAGPLAAGEEALAKRCRATLETWHVVDFGIDIAESAARLRYLSFEIARRHPACQRPDDRRRRVVTHDRDFAKVRGLRILG
jgi:predicted nucleic acid-binding protein